MSRATTYRFDGDNSGLRRTLAENRSMLEREAREQERLARRQERDAETRIRQFRRDIAARNRPLRADRGENPFTLESLGKSTGSVAGIAGFYAGKIALDAIGSTGAMIRKTNAARNDTDRIEAAIGGIRGVERIPLVGELVQFVNQIAGVTDGLEKKKEAIAKATRASEKMAAKEDAFAKELESRRTREGGVAGSMDARATERRKRIAEYNASQLLPADALARRRGLASDLASSRELDRLDLIELKRQREATDRGRGIDAFIGRQNVAGLRAEIGGDAFGAEAARFQAELAAVVRDVGDAVRAAEAELRRVRDETPEDAGAIGRAEAGVRAAQQAGFSADDLVRLRNRRNVQGLIDRENAGLIAQADADLATRERVGAAKFGFQTRQRAAGIQNPDEREAFLAVRRLQAEIAATSPQLRGFAVAAARAELEALARPGVSGGLAREFVPGRDLPGTGNAQSQRTLEIIAEGIKSLPQAFADKLANIPLFTIK